MTKNRSLAASWGGDRSLKIPCLPLNAPAAGEEDHLARRTWLPWPEHGRAQEAVDPRLQLCFLGQEVRVEVPLPKQQGLVGEGGEGVDVIVDSLSGEAITKGLSILHPGGRFIEIGAAGVVEVLPIDPTKLFLANQSFVGVNIGQLKESPHLMDAMAKRLEELLARGALRPQIGHTFSFEEASEALLLLRRRKNTGKVVLEL